MQGKWLPCHYVYSWSQGLSRSAWARWLLWEQLKGIENSREYSILQITHGWFTYCWFPAWNNSPSLNAISGDFNCWAGEVHRLIGRLQSNTGVVFLDQQLKMLHLLVHAVIIGHTYNPYCSYSILELVPWDRHYAVGRLWRVPSHRAVMVDFCTASLNISTLIHHLFVEI